jgi:uncharacterized membrane protein YqiK
MNLGNNIGMTALFVGFAVLVLARIYKGGSGLVFITDYQRGLRFVQGSFREVLGPGSHQSNPRQEQLTVVDMRPVPIVVERILYQDAVLAPSVVSIGAQLDVTDPLQASTKLKNQLTDSMAIVRDGVRRTMSKAAGGITPADRSKIASEIEHAVNGDLEKVGMRISQLEITEFWSRSGKPGNVTGAN